jgi:Peroxisomal biogenesis factor 11 (PEX11)
LKKVPSVEVGRKVVKNISSARKVFKFLRFVDEIKNIADLLLDKENKNGILVNILALFARICGFFYYILDNIVWFSNMGMVG